MEKIEFINEIKRQLKIHGYHKHGNYWYKCFNDIYYCINVQGSQWSKVDYYVEIGLAQCNSSVKLPTILQWVCRHRCVGKMGSKNIEPDELLNDVAILHNSVSQWEDVPAFLKKHNAKEVVKQYWF